MATLHFIFGAALGRPAPTRAVPTRHCQTDAALCGHWGGCSALGAVLMLGGSGCVGFWPHVEAAVELLGAEQGRERCLALPEGSGYQNSFLGGAKK